MASDRRHSRRRGTDKEMISQSSATFINKNNTGAGGYYRPGQIKNVELIKDPT